MNNGTTSPMPYLSASWNCAHSRDTFSCSCSYSNCLSLEKFADYLMIVHKKGLQDELNAHVRPQSRD